MRSIVLAAVLALLGSAAHADPTVVDMATISMSAPGVPRTVTDTVCASDGTDLVCDRGMVLTSSSLVGIGTAEPSSTLHLYSVTGAGAGLRVESNVGRISLESYTNTANVDMVVRNTGQFPLIQNTMRRLVVGTTGNIGIGGATGWINDIRPSSTLHVSGTLRIANGGEACDADRIGALRYTGGEFSFCRNGSAWETLSSIATGAAASADRISSGTTTMVVASATGFVSLTQSGTNTGWFDPSRGLVTLGVSSTGAISGTRGYFNAGVGIGAAPNSSYDLTVGDANVDGTAITGLGICTNNQTAIEVGQGATGNRNALIDLTGDSTYPDYGTRLIRTSGGANGSSRLEHRGTGSLLLVSVEAGSIVSQTSATDRLRVTSNGSVGIGTSAPSATLHVSGTGKFEGTVTTPGVQLAGSGDQCLTLADEGRMFFNATTRRLQVCKVY